MEQFVKHYDNGVIAAQIFGSQQELTNHENDIVKYRNEWQEIRTELLLNGLTLGGGFGEFCPYIQHFTLWFTKKEDIPAISENGMYLQFNINMKEKSIEVSRTGCIELSKEDKDKCYLYGCGLKEVHTHLGKKWMRKSRYKTEKDCADKMTNFFNDCLNTLERATEGYPYKKMKINIK